MDQMIYNRFFLNICQSQTMSYFDPGRRYMQKLSENDGKWSKNDAKKNDTKTMEKRWKNELVERLVFGSFVRFLFF